MLYFLYMNAFAALADDTRREIVRLVAKNGKLTSTEISQNFKMTPPAISQHLKVLKEAKVLHMKKEAQRRIYSLNNSGIDEMEDWLLDIKNLWNKRLDNLDKYLLKIKKEKSHDKKLR
ncbi:metalloregulator ArsR/SmtB family transcription factor [Leptospira interrogans]|nr:MULTISPECIES: metalloregulator ArsR/SmtB family transcription factor [Leptospira]EMG09042.1 transcriptional regulator, ArsR family [Leptospira interrogans serovar Grippotyphosa str. LT2186]EMM80542.1 transcriptional regulator, ArsR family [Leptospira interrogans str. 2006001854]EMM93299.1 transcriptional regulator, ArsR family [Leptospira interrogans serovar Zanoni str. LT2156]EMY05837.1 transcriptional regulator, ArsR family [Leptospira interrogans str. 2002000626]OBZ98037.1 Transcriptiona